MLTPSFLKWLTELVGAEPLDHGLDWVVLTFIRWRYVRPPAESQLLRNENSATIYRLKKLVPLLRFQQTFPHR